MSVPLDPNFDSTCAAIAEHSDALTEDLVYILIDRGLNAQHIERWANSSPNDERLFRMLDDLETDIATYNDLTLNRESWTYE